mmetsp:Transcript_128103/g.232893  ORF Transcript_128103/g.232893 Transcript_128103/m.232893 type:complete len:216 (-) Transcript_128103:418-1065(-)
MSVENVSVPGHLISNLVVVFHAKRDAHEGAHVLTTCNFDVIRSGSVHCLCLQQKTYDCKVWVKLFKAVDEGLHYSFTTDNLCLDKCCHVHDGHVDEIRRSRVGRWSWQCKVDILRLVAGRWYLEDVTLHVLHHAQAVHCLHGEFLRAEVVSKFIKPSKAGFHAGEKGQGLVRLKRCLVVEIHCLLRHHLLMSHLHCNVFAFQNFGRQWLDVRADM